MNIASKSYPINEYERDYCPECGIHFVISDSCSGDTICSNCGLIIASKMMDPRAEWRIFSNDNSERKIRAGLPSSFAYFDKGLHTVIDFHNRDAFGRSLSSNMQSQIKRLRKCQFQLHSSFNRNLIHALGECDRQASQLNLPKMIKERAALLYRRFIIKFDLRGHPIDAMVTATLYCACRLTKLVYMLHEFVKIGHHTEHEIGRCLRILVGALALKMPPQNPAQFVNRFGTELHLSFTVQQLATTILKQAQKRHLITGKDPSSCAAAALFIAALKNDERRTQQQFSEVVQTTTVTIRTRYKELVPVLHL